MTEQDRVEHRRIANDIHGKIRSGELKPNEKLPSTRQLADRYDVSTSTVYRAVLLLRDRGVVTGFPGKGVYVTTDRDDSSGAKR